MAESGRKLEFEAPPLSRKQQKSVSWVELTQPVERILSLLGATCCVRMTTIADWLEAVGERGAWSACLGH